MRALDAKETSSYDESALNPALGLARSAAVRNDRGEVNQREKERDSADDPNELLHDGARISLQSHFIVLRDTLKFIWNRPSARISESATIILH